jgi:hypothetical protein
MSTPLPPRQLCDCPALVTAIPFGKQDPNMKEALQSVVGQVINNHNTRLLKARGW